MKVLITGATGFLGGRTAETLLRAGHEVRGLLRPGRDPSALPAGTEPVAGDVTDADSVEAAAGGCDAVVHGAALVAAWHRDPRQFDRVNVQGVANVVAACGKAKARLLHVSSFVALGPTDGAVFDEDTPRASNDFHNHYERTKWLGDQLVRTLPPGSPEVVRLYPGVVYGPGALTAGNHVVKLLLDHARGRLPGMLGSGDLRQCFAYVDDVARGIELALQRAVPGRGYILGGENCTAIELFAAFESATGVTPPSRKIPFVVAGWIGKLQRWRAELFGIEPDLTDEVVGIYRHEWAYTSARAESELGYRVTGLTEGISTTVAWLRERGEI